MQHRGTLDIHTIFLRKPQYGTRKFRLQIIRTIPEISLGCPHMGLHQALDTPVSREVRKWKMEDFSSLRY